MPAKHDQVRLSPDERQDLLALGATGNAAAYKLTRARMLWQAAPSPQGPAWSDAPIHQALPVGRKTVERTRQAWVEVGLGAALKRKARARPGNQQGDGRTAAHLMAVACSHPPAGRTRWP